MKNIIHRVLACWITVCIEESKGEIAAGINRKPDFGDQVMSLGRRLCTANRAFDFRGITYAELVIISSERFQSLGFDLREQWSDVPILNVFSKKQVFFHF